ncbi:hypothetical protein [Hansschlegelia zhihuaiae]|uniref:Uncharacterized protein n=1 Tax=Hansschlegelia zhihuaiae TaxID=405005 RepID=A0A4Q0MNH4_9HYPH|nr:hypothetical protein [Hansschlegelia zhihuaiae]RXF75065.1 hypothetical protein EK403_03180 [Hansschlegelia zhihuaiae]
MTHRIDRGLEGVLRFVGWLFSRPALGIDLGLMAIAFGWVAVFIANPAVLDATQFALMRTINREAWVAILSMIGLAHAIGMASPWRLKVLRVVALFASGWLWLVVGTTFAPHLVTGAPTYVTIGFGALITALYVSRLRE